MNPTTFDVLTSARHLLAAADGAHLVDPECVDPDGRLTMGQAWQVAQALAALKTARGAVRAGWKIGFTNRSIWDRYGVHAPIWGPVWAQGLQRLVDGEQATVSLRGLCQPRLEPEIVFGLARRPEPGMSLHALQDCIDWVAHGFEIVHTHFDGWRFTAAQTVADGALHGRLVVGPRVSAKGWNTLSEDLAALRVELFQEEPGADAFEGSSSVGTRRHPSAAFANGAILRDRGHGALVLDGPLQALGAWVNAMAEHTPGWLPEPGEVVTTGTLTDAWPLAAGQVWHTRLQGVPLRGLVLRTTDDGPCGGA
jgi:2-oxo-3-hexenedioate decarboxylase